MIQLSVTTIGKDVFAYFEQLLIIEINNEELILLKYKFLKSSLMLFGSY